MSLISWEEASGSICNSFTFCFAIKSFRVLRLGTEKSPGGSNSIATFSPLGFCPGFCDLHLTFLAEEALSKADGVNVGGGCAVHAGV